MQSFYKECRNLTKGSVIMKKDIDKKTLESGRVLLYLKHEFLSNRSKETLFPLLSCLRDSNVIVPVNVTMSDFDKEKFLNSKQGDVVTTSDEIRCKPDILKNGDNFFFPMFSNEEQIPEEYGNNFSKVVLPVLRCINMAKSYEHVCGIVIDAFTEPLVLEYEIADLIFEFESRLKSED